MNAIIRNKPTSYRSVCYIVKQNIAWISPQISEIINTQCSREINCYCTKIQASLVVNLRYYRRFRWSQKSSYAHRTEMVDREARSNGRMKGTRWADTLDISGVAETMGKNGNFIRVNSATIRVRAGERITRLVIAPRALPYRIDPLFFTSFFTPRSIDQRPGISSPATDKK